MKQLHDLGELMALRERLLNERTIPHETRREAILAAIDDYTTVYRPKPFLVIAEALRASIEQAQDDGRDERPEAGPKETRQTTGRRVTKTPPAP